MGSVITTVMKAIQNSMTYNPAIALISINYIYSPTEIKKKSEMFSFEYVLTTHI
jgi:hypothetical protein